MTSWLNIGLFADDEEKVLKELFDSRYKDKLVDDSPPTVMFGSLPKRERRNLAEKFLHKMFDCVDTVVMVDNGDTSDSARAYIYTVPSDNRKIAEEKISGVSGADGGDVIAELIERGLRVSKSHHYNTLDVEDYMSLLSDEEYVHLLTEED